MKYLEYTPLKYEQWLFTGCVMKIYEFLRKFYKFLQNKSSRTMSFEAKTMSYKENLTLSFEFLEF